MEANNTLQQIDYRYEVSTEALNDPKRLNAIKVFLPSGASAVFIRADHWTLKTEAEV